MMDSKELIRKYEKIKNKKAVTIEDYLLLEKEWLSLHINMDQTSRKLITKRKKELAVFVKRSYEFGRQISLEIANMLSLETSFRFSEFEKSHLNLYVRSGIQGLYNTYLKVNRSQKTFDECISVAREKEQILSMNPEIWKEKVEQICSTSFSTRKEAFEHEKECIKLFSWKEKKKTTPEDIAVHFKKLCSYFDNLSNTLLIHLGYQLSVDHIAKGKKNRTRLRKLGMLSYLKSTETEPSSPIIESLLREINFVHPKDEFSGVRKLKRHFIIHEGPTNSGKTYHALQALKNAASGAYLAPLRLLALEIRDKMHESKIPCDLVTGDEVISSPGAKHRSSTIEMAKFDEEYEVAVIDEMQFIEDEKRGNGWLRAICSIRAKQVHLCGAAHATDFITSLIEECGDTYEIIHYKRQTPLVVEEETFSFPHNVRKGDALIAFTKSRVMELSDELRRKGFKVSVLYGKLPAATRLQQVALFSNGETNVIVATDVVGIGLNLPIERVVLMDIEKFDGEQKRLLTTQEIKQIAGRAGRRGHHESGFVNAPHGKDYISSCLQETEANIVTSVVAPSNRITELPIGTLRQRFIAWQKSEITVSYLKKADISAQIHLLKEIEEWEHELDTKDVFKAIYIPFDYRERLLLKQWVSHMEELKEGKKEIFKPRRTGSSLSQLELYYQQLHLYYQFGKKFKLNFDMAWFHTQKRKTSYEIDRSIFKRSNSFTA